MYLHAKANTAVGIFAACISCAACSEPASVLQTSAPPIERPAESTISDNPAQIAIRIPSDRVRSGVSVTPTDITLTAFALMPIEDVEREMADAIELLDATGANIPLTIRATLDENGMTAITVLPASPMQQRAWYQLLVHAFPPNVVLAGGESTWTVDLYTGHLLQIASVMQPEAPKDDVLYVKMTEEVDFDRRWAGRLFFDSIGQTIPGCVQFNGTCTNTGIARLREVAIVLPERGAGARVSQIAPFDAVGGPSSATRRPLVFTPCSTGAARCVTL